MRQFDQQSAPHLPFGEIRTGGNMRRCAGLVQAAGRQYNTVEVFVVLTTGLHVLPMLRWREEGQA
jgi:hypothetical protein